MRLSWLMAVLLLSSCGFFTTRQETYLEEATGKAKAVHLKLDELIRRLKGARNSLINLENLTDEELKDLQLQFERLRKKSS